MSQRALFLVNLGSPASTEVADVRRYLNQFLMDPYVIDLPWPVRRLLVSLILIRRPAESAQAYQSIWWPDGSPLVVLSRQLEEAMRAYWPHGPVSLAMRYGEPSIERSLCELAQQGIEEVVYVPLYPQFADSTTTTAIKEAERVVAKHQLKLRLMSVPPFYEDEDYLQALAASAQEHLAQPHDHVLLSFHGLPERHLQKIDPTGNHCLKSADCCERASPEVLATCYRAQCMRTAKGFARHAGLDDGRWSVAFQSRLGRAKWIEPYTEEQLDALAKKGVKKLLVMCPAFVADCIETLEEIGDRGNEQFVAAGGESLTLIPCLNSHPEWLSALSKICERVPVQVC